MTMLLTPTETRPAAAGGIACEADSIETVPLAEERSFAYWQQDIPQEYWGLTAAQLTARIQAARAKLGTRLVILGHHYQREDIIAFADERGDSFKLAQFAAARPEAEYIVFAGVHFMAEAADILSGAHQKVMLPNMAAGCSMADMADPDDVYNAWAELEELGIAQDTLPITYMNSAASLKAFVGERGGAVCTSSNARKVLEWAFAQKKRVLFFPDQHLGRNTGAAMGIPQEQMVLWGWARPYGSMGGRTLRELQDSRIILWAGHCSVHQRFTPRQIAEARAQHPDVLVVVHPECRLETVQAADLNGSTEFIAKTVREAPAGAVIGVGTEINLVSRLAKENPDKTVFCLDPVVCPCSTMYRVHPAYLAWTLEQLVEGRVVNRIAVPPEIAAKARLALDRMLAIR
ncbi:MAG TPA: quinolinate synthase NadA [Dehalococcoidia bacterium]|nr:quinolinate synthase NadA [Dehalococcoidia bacterium]